MAAYFVHRRRHNINRERMFQPRNKCLDTYDDIRLIKKYRFPRNSILVLIDICRPFMERTGNRNAHQLPLDAQILGCLRFMAKGNFQDDCGEIAGISQPSMSRAIRDFTNIMSEKADNFIKYPSEEEIPKLKEDFRLLRGFPNVIGIIDGTHIKIKSPSGPREPHYVCRKGGHSINVQVVCDADMKFINVVAKWPGATHDSYIWQNCYLKSKFQDMPPNGYLLGDSGYGIEPWLMTPLSAPRTHGELAYNKCLTETRTKVEQSIGLFKSVLRRFDSSGGVLLYTPLKACKIILTGCILHNMRRDLHLQEDEDFILQDDDDQELHINRNENALTQLGMRKREMLILNYFS